jgi:hypothetical protein
MYTHVKISLVTPLILYNFYVFVKNEFNFKKREYSKSVRK